MQAIVEDFSPIIAFYRAFNADDLVNQANGSHPQRRCAIKCGEESKFLPAIVNSNRYRFDVDLDSYTTDPIKISLAETVELLPKARA